MRILHLNEKDIRGGAARAAYRLNSGLRRMDVDSRMLVAERSSDDPSVLAFSTGPLDPVLRRIRYRQLTLRYLSCWLSRPEGYDPFTGPSSRSGARLATQVPSSDLVNIHRIADLLDYDALFRAVPPTVPFVWTQHDMNAFTGGCAYNYECVGFQKACGACPQLGSSNPNDLSHRYWSFKKAVFDGLRQQRLHIVTPSRWMASIVQHSSLMGRFPVSPIPNSLDTDNFSPQDRQMARSELGIPQNAKVVLFSAASVKDRRKGFAYLADALQHLDSLRDVCLVSVGKGKPTLETAVSHIHLGRIRNDRHLAQAYSAADLFAIPSLEDNLPNTVMEALSCGTPVVGFAVGGIPEMIRQGKTGLLVPSRDVRALRSAIARLLEKPQVTAAMRDQCRHFAVKEYALHVQAGRYRALYEELLDHS